MSRRPARELVEDATMDLNVADPAKVSETCKTAADSYMKTAPKGVDGNIWREISGILGDAARRIAQSVEKSQAAH